MSEDILVNKKECTSCEQVDNVNNITEEFNSVAIQDISHVPIVVRKVIVKI